MVPENKNAALNCSLNLVTKPDEQNTTKVNLMFSVRKTPSPPIDNI